MDSHGSDHLFIYLLGIGVVRAVTRSKCPSLIGLEGIVLLETEQTFQIITPENQLRGAPARPFSL
jgi:RNase P/RNase MRP subunit p29